MAIMAIGFPDDFEQISRVAIQVEGQIPEHEHIWIWDHYFALVMHQLREEETAETLLKTLGAWAADAAPRIYSPANELHAENIFKFDTKLSFGAAFDACHEVYAVETHPEPGTWPGVSAKLAANGNEKRMAYSVLAMGQYFLAKNPMFFRELPLHILAMRKYYQETASYSEEESVQGAPAAAFQTAMKFFTDMSAKAHN